MFHCFAGPHCEVCAAGYFGDAKNGGTCEGTVNIPGSLWLVIEEIM